MTSSPQVAPSEPNYYTVSQAAARLGVSRITIWRWIRDGHLPAVRIGPRTTRIKREDVEQKLVQAMSSDSSSWTVPGGDTMADTAARTSRRSHRSTSKRHHLHHAVQFYESDANLVDTVAEFLGDGLRAGDAGILVATRPHRHEIEARLREVGIDLDTAVAQGQCVLLDAAETLSRIMVGGTPDAARFEETIDTLLARTGKKRRQIRVFGEMVALLAAERNYTAAVELEMLWNDLQRRRRFALLCAYPIGQLGDDTLADVLADVCSAHDTVIPSESYSRLPSERDQSHAIVALQQKVHWLQAQVEERDRVEEALRHALVAERDARQEAIDVQRKRDELFSIAAQELKHPLHSLSLQAQQALFRLGREVQLEPAKVERAVEAIAGRPAEIPRLIGQLVSFSQLNARKLALQPRRTDLPSLIETVLADMRARGAGNVITLSAPEPREAWIDPERTRLVLACLIDNAIKYSPRGGAIDVTLAAAASGSVEIAVRDHGTGIPPERRASLFERSDDDDEDAGPGLKLSLFVSRQIVELHGGELYAEFPPDRGTRFVMRLPIGREESTVLIAAD